MSEDTNGSRQHLELHFVLRYSNELHGFDTIVEHREVIERCGKVWMGKFGLGVASSIADTAKQQVEAGVNTRVYLAGSGKTKLKGIVGGGVRGQYPSPDPKLTPKYYSKRRCSVWFLLDRISKIGKGELDSLRLYKDPGLIACGLPRGHRDTTPPPTPTRSTSHLMNRIGSRG